MPELKEEINFLDKQVKLYSDDFFAYFLSLISIIFAVSSGMLIQLLYIRYNKFFLNYIDQLIFTFFVICISVIVFILIFMNYVIKQKRRYHDRLVTKLRDLINYEKLSRFHSEKLN